jgi:hypothetical protein
VAGGRYAAAQSTFINDTITMSLRDLVRTYSEEASEVPAAPRTFHAAGVVRRGVQRVQHYQQIHLIKATMNKNQIIIMKLNSNLD